MKPASVGTALAILAVLASVVCGCAPGGEPEIAIGMDGCASCGMAIPEANQACAFTVDKDTHTFCSSGCLLKEYEARRQAGMPPPDALYFADYETGALAREGASTFILTSRVPSVMRWGILNFADHERAAAFQEDGDILVDWPGLRRARGEVDRVLEVILTPSGLVPEIVELEKGQLVDWTLRGQDLLADTAVELRGYEELGEIVVPASGEARTTRLLTQRPGQGFAVVRIEDGAILGQVRIHGAHTADEVAP